MGCRHLVAIYVIQQGYTNSYDSSESGVGKGDPLNYDSVYCHVAFIQQFYHQLIQFED